jgi:hypothetical protein
MSLDHAIVLAGAELGGRFTLSELRDRLACAHLEGVRPTFDDTVNALKRLAEMGRVRWAGVRLLPGLKRLRVFEVVTSQGQAYREFVELVECYAVGRRRRFHLLEMQAQAQAALGNEFDLERTQRYLVRMLRERRVKCLGVNRRDELVFVLGGPVH